MASLAVNFIAELPSGEEVVAPASLDTVDGFVSPLNEWPAGVVSKDGWIEVYGGSELFFRVVAGTGGKRYQVVDKQGLDRCRDQLDWLAESLQISGQRGRYVGAEGAVCVR